MELALVGRCSMAALNGAESASVSWPDLHLVRNSGLEVIQMWLALLSMTS